jgi:hypothetical protein
VSPRLGLSDSHRPSTATHHPASLPKSSPVLSSPTEAPVPKSRDQSRLKERLSVTLESDLTLAEPEESRSEESRLEEPKPRMKLGHHDREAKRQMKKHMKAKRRHAEDRMKAKHGEATARMKQHKAMLLKKHAALKKQAEMKMKEAARLKKKKSHLKKKAALAKESAAPHERPVVREVTQEAKIKTKVSKSGTKKRKPRREAEEESASAEERPSRAPREAEEQAPAVSPAEPAVGPSRLKLRGAEESESAEERIAPREEEEEEERESAEGRRMPREAEEETESPEGMTRRMPREAEESESAEEASDASEASEEEFDIMQLGWQQQQSFAASPVLQHSQMAQAPRQEKRERLTYAQPIVTFAQPIVQKVDMSPPKVQKQTLLAQAIVQPVSGDTDSHSRFAPSSHLIMLLTLLVSADSPLLAVTDLPSCSGPPPSSDLDHRTHDPEGLRYLTRSRLMAAVTSVATSAAAEPIRSRCRLVAAAATADQPDSAVRSGRHG